MRVTGGGRVENITRLGLGGRLRRLATRRFPGEAVGRQELNHLVQVITNEALLLTDLYASVSLRSILDRRLGTVGPLPRALADTRGRGPLYEVRRLPDQIKAVGDKALFDVGLIGQAAYRGVPLLELGPRSYEFAAAVLERLAEDETLARYFRDNRLRAMSLEEEVAFLQQCARRFTLHAEILQALRADTDRTETTAEPVIGTDVEGGSGPRAAAAGAAPCAPSPPPPPPAAQEAAEAGMSDPGTALLAPVAARPASPRGRTLMSQEELLAACERVLLFSELDLEALRQELERRVVDQRPAIRALCDEFALFAAGTEDLNRPPSYLFVGPTGVGKNHLVESLIELLETAWGIEIPFLTLEGPNFTYPSDINELRGATRGFIRSDEDGMLTEFHQRAIGAPLAVILVDEVEKAHPQLRKFFLSIMDRGTVTDNRGHVLHFGNCMVIYTSNIGYSDLARGAAPIGYLDQEDADRRFGQEVRRELRRALSPEFVNRLRVVPFDYLAPGAFEAIFDLELEAIARRFAEVHGLELEVTAAARRAILERGTSHDFGARHLRARLETLVTVEVSRRIKADELPRSGSSRLVRYLRALKVGGRPFDPEAVRARVLRQAGARVSYRRVVVDFAGGAFTYRGRE